MITKRLINCDFLNTSGFKVGLSNKAKLLYFLFITNADDLGFVGNGKEIANTLDRCEEDYENALFQVSYVDSIHELVEKRLVYEFSDKVGNKTYLIRHWFYHNKYQSYLTTNFSGYFSQVELIDNEYHLLNHQEKKPYKENKIKENKIKENNSNSLNINDLDSNAKDNSIEPKEDIFEKLLRDLEE